MSRKYLSLSSTSAIASIAGIACAIVSPAVADEIGYDALVARLGGTGVPTGAGIRIGQVEASTNAANPAYYGPDQVNAEFVGKTFSAQSGAPQVSSHATFVAQQLYGNTTSVARGVTLIYLWEASSFINSNLRYGAGSTVAPLTPPSTALKIYNNSWIGGTSGGPTPNAVDLEILRRADFAMNRDDTIYTVGCNNGATSVTYPLMAMGYHGLSVGLTSGGHSHGDVPAAGDGPGRQKPEIVAPGTATSWATPVVGACAALLFETAATHPSVSLNPNADETVVIKAALMAGATHRAGWTNNPQTSGPLRGVTVKPLDTTYGVDVVNIDRGHQILTGAEHNGAATSAAATTLVPPAGWDFEQIAVAATRYWKFRVVQTVSELSVVASWHRTQTNSVSVPTVANIDLTLFRVGADGITLEPLEGEAGAIHYTQGNVASRSPVDNVEHLYVKGLAPGDYMIEVKRTGSMVGLPPFSIAWHMPAPSFSIADLNQDGVVDGLDMTVILSNWLGTGAGDINADGIVDGIDLTYVLSGWTA
ncbi:MAG: hypothetical protein EXS03_01775 [Phycisphaerales bacterium]|nr:hypothetical protein [Phycisphaerales bacterium]